MAVGGWIGPGARGCDLRRVGAQGARGDSGHYGARGLGVSAHALVGCQGAGDLHEVHEEEHQGPGELQAAPDVCDEGEGVFVDCCAEGGGYDGAVDEGGGWARDGFEVWEEVSGCGGLGLGGLVCSNLQTNVRRMRHEMPMMRLMT